jgi:hypothetical protein
MKCPISENAPLTTKLYQIFKIIHVAITPLRTESHTDIDFDIIFCRKSTWYSLVLTSSELKDGREFLR